MSVYLIAAEQLGLGKIGHATDPAKRLRELQTGSPTRLSLLGTLPGGRTEELRLHVRHDDVRRHGEWFELSARLLVDFGCGEWQEGKQPLCRMDYSTLVCPFCLSRNVIPGAGDYEEDWGRISFYCDSQGCEARQFDVILTSHAGMERKDVELLMALDSGDLEYRFPEREARHAEGRFVGRSMRDLFTDLEDKHRNILARRLGQQTNRRH